MSQEARVSPQQVHDLIVDLTQSPGGVDCLTPDMTFDQAMFNTPGAASVASQVSEVSTLLEFDDEAEPEPSLLDKIRQDLRDARDEQVIGDAERRRSSSIKATLTLSADIMDKYGQEDFTEEIIAQHWFEAVREMCNEFAGGQPQMFQGYVLKLEQADEQSPHWHAHLYIKMHGAVTLRGVRSKFFPMWVEPCIDNGDDCATYLNYILKYMLPEGHGDRARFQENIFWRQAQGVPPLLVKNGPGLEDIVIFREGQKKKRGPAGAAPGTEAPKKKGNNQDELHAKFMAILHASLDKPPALIAAEIADQSLSRYITSHLPALTTIYNTMRGQGFASTGAKAILILGHSNAGKTTLARTLAQEYMSRKSMASSELACVTAARSEFVPAAVNTAKVLIIEDVNPDSNFAKVEVFTGILDKSTVNAKHVDMAPCRNLELVFMTSAIAPDALWKMSPRLALQFWRRFTAVVYVKRDDDSSKFYKLTAGLDELASSQPKNPSLQPEAWTMILEDPSAFFQDDDGAVVPIIDADELYKLLVEGATTRSLVARKKGAEGAGGGGL